jgi:hypothetical protein
MRLNIGSSALVAILALGTLLQPSFAEEPKYSDANLTSFLVANTTVVKIQEQKKRLINDFEQKAIQVIQSSGLTLDEYNSIVNDLRQDEELKNRLKALIEKLNQETQTLTTE